MAILGKFQNGLIFRIFAGFFGALFCMKKKLECVCRDVFGNFIFWVFCMGYSPGKMVSFAQKLKLKKNMQKSVLQPTGVHKAARKNTKYSRNEANLKISHHAKAISLCKMVTSGQKLKFQNTCRNRFYNPLE